MNQNKLQDIMLKYSSLKSLQIVMALSTTNSYTGISDLVKMTGLSKSTLHRILNELLECNFVIKDEKEKKFKLGYQMINLAMNIQVSDYLVEISKEEMKYLNDISGETISLVVMSDYEGVYIGKMEAKNQISLKFKVGWRLPLYCTSSGKAILANQSKEFLDGYFRSVPLKKFTDDTVTDQQQLKMELKEIKKQGYAMDIKEHNHDIICISAPIFLNNKCVGTIGIVAPSYRFCKEKALLFKDDVLKASQKITDKLLSYI